MYYTFIINFSGTLYIVWLWKELSLNSIYPFIIDENCYPKVSYLLVILWYIFDQAGDRRF